MCDLKIIVSPVSSIDTVLMLNCIFVCRKNTVYLKLFSELKNILAECKGLEGNALLIQGVASRGV